MSKSNIPMEVLKNLVKKHVTDSKAATAVLQEAKNFLQEQVAEKAEKAVKPKPQFVLVVTKPTTKGEMSGWAVTIPEEESPATVIDKIKAAGRFHNNAPKKGRGKKKNPVHTVGEMLAHGSTKAATEFGLKIKHRDPVWVQVINPDDSAIPDAPKQAD